METILASPYLILFARLTLGGVFVLSALTKLLDRAEAAAAFEGRAWLPPALARLGARVLPWAEALVGVLLVLGWEIRLAALGAGILLVVFTTVVLGDLRGGRAMACHCFGRLSRETASPLIVVRNLVLLVLAGLLAWQPVPYIALDGLAAGSSTAPLPSVIDAVPVFFLASAAVIAVVLGSSLVSTIRGFLRAF
jgi:uncharacterized membrane protein YphA (DoxX/SURF4 family)